MSLKDAVIRSVAAEEDEERRYKLAAAMLMGQETTLLQEVCVHALQIAHGKVATDRQRAAARIVIEALALLLLTRVEVMDEEFDRLLDEVVEKDLAEAEHDLPLYDREAGLSIFLEPDHEDAEDMRDMAFDLQAMPEHVYLGLRVVEEGAQRLGGWLHIQDVPELQRCLAIIAADAQAWRHDGEAEDGE